ncbi:MAG: S-formylglutathione hydrolase [Nostocales cyanobacterium]|nr:MAG: S-formylglutathione hydrolase [Nostocales cyanobacterium]TAF16357.1 MAG: S-formylglutathione hydrolase [Nostocales cyanobacterium]
MTNINLIAEYKSFGGKLGFYAHISDCCKCEMRFSVYQPPQATEKPLPVLYFLSGLTCREDNFMIKSGAQYWAAKYGIILVAPDTSPRMTGTPGEDDEWDIGTGAGFYVDATQEPWKNHYQMYSYIVQELPAVINSNFPTKPEKQSIFGHSMGGHGALICAIRNPDIYKSVSAFAPIVAPMNCAWGEKAFSLYLGNNKESWCDYDASKLVEKLGYHREILIDQGTADEFLNHQLLPEQFIQVCEKVNQPLNFRYQPGYDHSYYFIATFIGDHIRHHAQALGL